MSKIIAGIDCETVDPLLKTAGYSWKYGQGYVLNTALYYEAEDKVKVIAGLHNENCPFSEAERELENAEIVGLLQNPDVCLVGANIMYDIGWLLYEYQMSTYDVKCSLVDVLQAEHMINEFAEHTLESVSQKYLKYGKKKDRIEDWVRENVSRKGDFRKYLKDAPWDLLVEYVAGDAKNPVKVWRKQLTLLKQQDLCQRTKLEFDCILPVLAITRNGYPVNYEQKKKNCVLLTHYRDLLKSQFETKYGVKNFNVNSSRNIASLCDKLNIPYNCKITIKNETENVEELLNDVRRVVRGFGLVKNKIVSFVPSSLAERTVELLQENGFICNCSPNVDKKFFASKREQFEVIGVIADWKLCNGILSKILGEDFDRFICFDSDGQARIRGQFKISDTATLRLSSQKPNLQQVSSKGSLKITENGEDKEIFFAELVRSLFTSEKGKVLIKADFSQEEQRLLAHYAVGEGSEEVRKAYKENPHLDFHQYVVNLTGLTRKYAKNMSFGITYGMSVKSMAENFGWTIEKAEEISEQYHSKMPFVAPTFELARDIFKERGYIKTVCGARARLPAPNKAFTALNRLCQGGGADILKSAIVNAYKEGLWKRLDVKNTIHEERNFWVSATEQGVLDTFRMLHLMTNSVELRVPLLCEPEIGTDWVHVKELKEWLELRDSKSREWTDTRQEIRDFVNLCEKLKKEGKISYD